MTSKSELLTTVVGLYLSNEHVLVDHVALIVDSVQSRRLLTDDEQVDEQDQHARRKWTVRLNSLLQSKESTTRWAALVLLHTTCEQSPNLLVANIRSWANQLLGLIAKPDTTLVHKAAVKTLAFLFAYTAGKPELQREITTPSLPRFNHLLLGLSQRADLLDTVLDALATNMKTFPSLSRHAVDHTVKMCLGYLDGAMHVAPSTLDKVSACLIAVHYTGGRATPAEQWKDIVLKLIGSYHQALDRLFATVDEEWTVEDRPEEFPLVPAMADYVVGFSVMMRRIKALQIALSTALGMSTSVAVPVPVGQLVNLICRGYSVFEGSLMREFKDKTEFAALMLNLPAIHQTANKLLTSLLISSGPHLIPFVKLFARLFVRLLGDYQKQRTLKISVYQLTTLCLQKYGLVFAEAIESVVVPNVLQDTTVHVHKVTSVVTTDTKESKKKRKRNDLTHSDAMLAQHATEAPHDIQMAALQALEQLLLCYGASMDINTRNSIDSHILQRLLEISQKPLALAPESDQLIKEHLYPCLLASVMAPLQVQASILPYAVRIFSAGINEQNLKLQSLCRQGVAICDLIMHPRMPPLQMGTAIITRQLVQAADKEKQKEKEQAAASLRASEAAAVAPAAAPQAIASNPFVPPTTAASTDPAPVTRSWMETSEDNTTSKKARLDTPPMSSSEPIAAPASTLITTEPVAPAESADNVLPDASPSSAINENVVPVSTSDLNTTIALPSDEWPTAVAQEQQSVLEEPTAQEPQAAEKPVAAVVAPETEHVPSSNLTSEDLDMDSFEIPDIDMAGPDSDEE